MFLKLTKAFGKPICVILYAVFAWLPAKKKPIPLLTLMVMHLGETFTVGRKVAKEHQVPPLEWLIQCICFGFTWWLPLKMSE